MSCRFTTCLDSRKTGHRVRQSIFEKDVKLYGWGLPESLRSVGEGGERDQRIRRGEGLGPFIIDTLKYFGAELADSFLCKYEQLPGAAGLTTADPHLLEPYDQILGKLSKMESLHRVHAKEFVQEAHRELNKLKEHVGAMRSDWPTALKKKSGSTQNRNVDNLRRRFNSGPDAPHLSFLGDVPTIRASYAYHLCKENTRFAFSMAFDVLCQIKARESGGTILDREFAELMTIPKIAVRTLSALRTQT
jgi:hypothetical protein